MDIKIRSTCLCIQNTSLLLIQMKDPLNGKIYWYPPGGKIEHGETPKTAVEREVYEETGSVLKLLSEEFATVEYTANWCGKDYFCINYTFIGNLISNSSEKNTNILSREYELELKWIDFADLDQYLYFSPTLLETTKKIIKNYLSHQCFQISNDPETQEVIRLREMGRVNFGTAMYGARAEGKEEGIKQGKEQGSENKLHEVIGTMHSKGMNGEQIASILDLELKLVEQILRIQFKKT